MDLDIMMKNGGGKSMREKWWADSGNYIPDKGEFYPAVLFSASPTLLAIYINYLYLFEFLYLAGKLATYKLPGPHSGQPPIRATRIY